MGKLLPTTHFAGFGSYFPKPSSSSYNFLDQYYVFAKYLQLFKIGYIIKCIGMNSLYFVLVQVPEEENKWNNVK